MLKKKFICAVFLFLLPFILHRTSLLAETVIDGWHSFEARCHEPGRGPQGSIGPAGLTGSTGAQGNFGPAGYIGPIGPTGPTGGQGPFGPQGLVGPVGITGPTGRQGPDGPEGQAGPTGIFGDTGPIGPDGPTGPGGPVGQILGFANAFSPTVQVHITPGSTVLLQVMAAQTFGFALSGGGISVPATGYYQIRYTVAPSVVVAVILKGSITGTLLSSSSASVQDNTNLFGSVTVFLMAGEVVTIINDSIITTFDTAQPAPIVTTVSMTILWLQ